MAWRPSSCVVLFSRTCGVPHMFIITYIMQIWLLVVIYINNSAFVVISWFASFCFVIRPPYLTWLMFIDNKSCYADLLENALLFHVLFHYVYYCLSSDLTVSLNTSCILSNQQIYAVLLPCNSVGAIFPELMYCFNLCILPRVMFIFVWRSFWCDARYLPGYVI